MIQLLYGDSLQDLKTRPSSSVDLFIQDLPYGTTKNKWDKKIDLHLFWPEWIRVGKDNCAFLFFADIRLASELINSNPKMFRYDIIWQKTNATGFLNAKKMPLRSHEFILVFYKTQPTYNPQKTKGHPRKISSAHHKRNSVATSNYGSHGLSSYDSTDRYPTSIIKIKRDTQKKSIHATQKPVHLLEWLGKTYSNMGDTWYDGFSGSGSTGFAAHNLGCNCILVEKDLNEYNKSKNNLQNVLFSHQPLPNE